MRVKLTINVDGINKLEAVLDGYEPLVEKLQKAMRKAAREYYDDEAIKKAVGEYSENTEIK